MNDTTQGQTIATFAVTGMNCGSCAGHVTEALRSNLNLSCDIDLPAKRVTVAFDPGQTSTEAIARVRAAAGYPVTAV